jgi:hypothetical protein
LSLLEHLQEFSKPISNLEILTTITTKPFSSKQIEVCQSRYFDNIEKIVIQQLPISTLNLPTLEKINLVRGYISMYPSRQPKYGWMWEKK